MANALCRKVDAESFDYVILRDSLHPIYNHEGQKGVITSLENAFYYLRKGGKLVIRDAVRVDPNKNRSQTKQVLSHSISSLSTNMDNNDWDIKGIP